MEDNTHVAAVLDDLTALDEPPDLMRLLEQQELVRSGIDLVIDDVCPLCDTEWAPAKLKTHLQAKLDKAKEAKSFASKLTQKGTTLASDAQLLVDKLEILAKHAVGLRDAMSASSLRAWKDDLTSFHATLRTAKGIVDQCERLESDWSARPDGMTATLRTVREQIDALKAPSESDGARDYLVVCDERLDLYRTCRGKHEQLKAQTAAAKRAKKLFEETVEEHLSRLYSAIEEDLVRFYCIINGDDEEGFQAKLDPADGKLTLQVDFYNRGLFPPGAYHSEGHQDGMGLCLYLALMKQLFGDRFTFGVLDDVLMSVDKGHRRQVCALLKKEFANTQFIITTHDDVWLHEMISATLIEKGSVKRFRGWTVEHGPLVHDFKEVWESIDEHLAKDDAALGGPSALRTESEKDWLETDVWNIAYRIDQVSYHEKQLRARLEEAPSPIPEVPHRDAAAELRSTIATWDSRPAFELSALLAAMRSGLDHLANIAATFIPGYQRGNNSISALGKKCAGYEGAAV